MSSTISVHSSRTTVAARRCPGQNSQQWPHLKFLNHSAREDTFKFKESWINSSFSRGKSREVEAQTVGWDRTPIRRKQHRSRCKQVPRRCPTLPSLNYLGLAFLIVYYYTEPCRYNPGIIMMDSLILYHCAKGFCTAYLDALQARLNKTQHSLVGNTTTILLDDLIPTQTTPQNGSPTHHHRSPWPIDQSTTQSGTPHFTSSDIFTRDVLLLYRQSRAPHMASILPSLAPRPHLKNRGGRRIQLRAADSGQRMFLKSPKPSPFPVRSRPPRATPHGKDSVVSTQLNSGINKHKEVKLAPPPRGAPGTHVVNEECNPTLPKPSPPSGRGSRLLRRRLYRQWRSSRGGVICQGRLGKGTGNREKPQRAAHGRVAGKNNAGRFRTLVLEQSELSGPQRKPRDKTMTTPQLEYGFKLKIATQNVQGMAEVLKHHQVLEIMKSFSLHILFLTETRSTSYYTYNSQGFLFVVNGSTTDKYAGITTVIHPSIRPYIKDFIQYSPRITRVTISLQSGNSHIFGVYAPHDKLENEEVKSPFWDALQSAMISLPAPEPAYIIGDFNVRLQGRSRHEHDIMGPHVYGKGYSSAKTGPQQNRTYYTSFLRDTSCVDALTYKTPNLLHHITYRDKNPPPQEWSQFALDSIKVLQFWDKISALPTPPEEALCIAQTIRLFLTADPLLNPLPQTRKIDPFRFQSLDKIVCKKQWLPSILQCRAHHNTGFPSDHYLLKTILRIKLGSKEPKIPRLPKPDYSSSTKSQEQFAAAFRTHYVNTASPGSETKKAPEGPHVRVYTDGSGSKGRASAASPAGWGFVVFDDSARAHKACGPVLTTDTSPYYLGASVGSNNTAEISAIMESILYLLRSATPPTKVTIYYDSKWAAQMTRGLSRPKKHNQLIFNARACYEKLKNISEIEWVWIKGHTGNQGNELADALAEQGKIALEAQGGRYTQAAPLLLSNLNPPALPIRGETAR